MMPGFSGPIASRKRANITDDSHELYGIHGNHPAIITSEIFDKVQEEKKYRSNIEAGETGSCEGGADKILDQILNQSKALPILYRAHSAQ